MAEASETAPVVNKNKRHRKDKRTSTGLMHNSHPHQLNLSRSLGHG